MCIHLILDNLVFGLIHTQRLLCIVTQSLFFVKLYNSQGAIDVYVVLCVVPLYELRVSKCVLTVK